MIPIARRIADELQVRVSQVEATIALLDDKSTVPFIARYRKEATGGLDDTQLRTLAERLTYLRELEDRRAAIIESITAQGKLTPELAAFLDAADTKARLEDLYLPYKPKRRTRAQIAREAGLEPLALGLLQNPQLVPEQAAAAYVDPEKGIADAAAALEGARWILMEQFSEDAELVGGLRQLVWERGEWRSTVVPGKESEGVKFSDYFSATERLKTVPSHRVLALLRGRKEGFLRLAVALPDEEGAAGPTEPERRIAGRAGIEQKGRPADAWLAETVRWTWKVRLLAAPRDRERAAAARGGRGGSHPRVRPQPARPAAGGAGRTAHDDGTRSGAADRRQGRCRRRDRQGARHGDRLSARAAQGLGRDAAHAGRALRAPRRAAHLDRQRHRLTGNRRARRRSDQAASGAGADEGRGLRGRGLGLLGVGARRPGVPRSRRVAARRGSIARRLQDPLAELVRIEPKAIGVGQYQHDLNQALLARQLDAVVEDCVNAVGADVNTASAPLLARISGLNETLARNIVAFRDTHGAFKNRKQLLKVPRIGDRTFQQAAGSFASRTATTRSTRQPSIPRPTRSSSGSSRARASGSGS